jgi:hypothetical protein
MPDKVEYRRRMDAYLVERIKTIIRERSFDTFELYLAGREKVLQGFLSALSSAAGSAEPMIEADKKGKIRFMQFSYLLSAALMKELRLRIDLYDSRHYADMTDVGGYWDYQELFPYIDDDMAKLKGELEKQFRRVRDYEIFDIRNYYHVAVFALIGEILKDIVAKDAFAESLTGAYEAEVAVLFGAYLDQSELIATVNK